MNHTLKKIDQNQKELTVELIKDDLKFYVDKAESDLGQNLRLDGFRKGKIPRDLFKKNLDYKQVLELALDLATRDSLAKVIEKEGLDVINVSDLEIKENTQEKLVYKVVLTLFPEVKIQDFSTLQAAKKKITVEDKDVNDALEKIKASRSLLNDKDGEVQSGDRIEVDFEVKQNGQIIDGGISKNHPLIVGGKNFMPGFEDNLLGMKQNEEKTFSLIAPKDYYVKKVAGQKLDFTVRVNSIKSVQLPELNDEFAETLGNFKNLDELRDSIREGIGEEKKKKEKQRVRLEIVNYIVSKSSIVLPEILVKDQIDSMIASFDKDLHANSMELGPYLAQMGKTQDDLRKEWRNEAEKQVKIAMILHRLARDNNITASHEEVDESLNAAVQAIMTRGQTDKSELDIENLREGIVSRITNEKVLEFLEEKYST